MRRRKSSPDNDYAHFGDVDAALLRILYAKPATLILQSSGGDMYAMTAAVDFLRENPIVVLATGCCFSAAVPILAMGVTRRATPMTRFMVHPGKAMLEVERTVDDIESERRELDRLEEIYIDILAGRTNRDSKWWRRQVAKSWHFGVEEAEDIGLIDEIA